LLRSPEAEEFEAAARAFCSLIDRHAGYDAAQLLVAVEPLLARVYQAGASLTTEVTPTSEHPADDKVSVDDVQEINHALGAILGRYDAYWELFDPLESSEEPVGGMLSGDLTEIYLDLRNALALLAPGRDLDPSDVLWEWRFAFASHWGRHAASGLRVVNSLLHTHFVQALSDSPDA
jgi:hypothetical protein